MTQFLAEGLTKDRDQLKTEEGLHPRKHHAALLQEVLGSFRQADRFTIRVLLILHSLILIPHPASRIISHDIAHAILDSNETERIELWALMRLAQVVPVNHHAANIPDINR